jgi:hypothetical protein
MWKELVYLGTTPSDEPCVQVGDPDYTARALAECRAYIEAIRKVVGEEPGGATLRVKREIHDFGTYYETVCEYDPSCEAAAEYALRCDEHAPTTWAEAGMAPPRQREGRHK